MEPSAPLRCPQRPVDATSVPASRSIDFVAMDADAILKDACGMLGSGRESPLLHTIDTGTVVAVMSDQAFKEIGWMSAPAARGHKVADAELRALLTTDYLPRIPVVATPAPGSGHWMPPVDDVIDPKDVAHVQVARLVSGTAVYSHDRHLRIPGHAPRSRVLYDERLERLGLIGTYRAQEQGVALVLMALGRGTNSALAFAATQLRLSRAVTWSLTALIAAAALFGVQSKPSRRAQIGAAAWEIMVKIVEANDRNASAEALLRSARLLVPSDLDRLEVMVASHLLRHPDSNMSEISDELGLTGRDRSELSVLLREHPAFEPASRWGWSVGRIRQMLETEPSTDWRPKQ